MDNWWKSRGARVAAILAAVFTLLPLIDVVLLVAIGRKIGLLETVALVILTGVLGGIMAKNQFYAVIRQGRSFWDQGEMPTDSFLDGAIVLVACGMLCAPGFITDIVGLMLLLPPVRSPIRRWARKHIEKWMQSQFELNVVEL